MRVKTFFFSAVLFGLPFYICSATGYNTGNSNGYNNSGGRGFIPAEDNQSMIRQVKVVLSELKNELQNHESEIRMFENRLHNQETIMDTIRLQLTDSVQNQQNTSKAQITDLEYKTDAMNETLKGLVTDLRQMKIQSNDFVSVLALHKQKMIEFEKLMDAQNQHMKNLELALNSMMEVIRATDLSEKNPKTEEVRIYKVQPGDNLEKIARFHKVSVQSIRDLNNLSKDRIIIIGQTLKIPI